MLPLRITPMPGEPPHGVLVRLAMRHQEADVAIFTATHGCPLSKVLQGSGLSLLADLTGIGLQELQRYAPCLDTPRREVRLAGEALLLNDWSTKKRRWCAPCFRGDREAARQQGRHRSPGPWHRAVWDVRSVAVCLFHLTALSDKCAACNGMQGWRGPRLDRCMCGGDLADGHQAAATGPGALSSSYIAGRLGLWTRMELPLVDGLPLKDAIITLERLGECQAFGYRSRKPVRRPNADATHRDRGVAMVRDWPRSFKLALDAVVARSGSDPGRARGLIATYGWVYSQWLSKTLPPALAPLLRDEFARHACANQVVSPGEPLFGSQGTESIDMTTASSKLGTSSAVLKRQLTAEGLMPPGARRGVAVPLAPSLITAIFDRRAVELGIGQAAIRLGIGRAQTRTLLNEGLLQHLRLQHVAGRRISEAEIEAFAARLLATRTEAAAGMARRTSLPAACRAKGVRLAVACQAIVEGKLRVLAVDEDQPGLRALLVSPGDLVQLRQCDRGISVEIAARELGIHPEVVRWLVMQGHMRRVPLGGSGFAGIERSSAKAFSLRYVTCASLARVAATSPRKLADTLARSGLHPAFGPPECRQIFYERAFLPSEVLGWEDAQL